MAAVYLVKMLSDGISMDFSADKSTMVQVNAWANADTVVYSHIASLGHNELIITVNKLSCRQHVSDCTSHGPVHRCLVTDPLSNVFYPNITVTKPWWNYMNIYYHDQCKNYVPVKVRMCCHWQQKLPYVHKLVYHICHSHTVTLTFDPTTLKVNLGHLSYQCMFQIWV